MYAKNNYDSPLIGKIVRNSNSLKINSRRNYSTLKNKIDERFAQVDPWFITGFTDAEGCFMCNMVKKPKYKAGWEIQPVFQIKLHVKDFPVILGIQHSLGNIGTVENNQSTCTFRVRKLKEIIELIKFFDKYPLITRKKGDYLLFKQIVSIIQLKEHLTTEGLQIIINLKATLNFGLSKELQLMFPETISVARPLREPCVIPHSQWISGFTSGFTPLQCLSGFTSNDSGELSHLDGELSHLRKTCEISHSKWLAAGFINCFTENRRVFNVINFNQKKNPPPPIQET